ncbi:hypothetical protein EZV61_15745 [Corallincola luteus]|uniref:Fibronectin type-III domain-containing protein n=1 Tax=Corallincola luteus TaxID=1775177 RepID=A0ABY2AIS1_9GAMM|nr:hypothetical protein [Corallincola luteus]TCI02026.1 hypothetical protein EZV61_15745 [Corallincola luteus]
MNNTTWQMLVAGFSACLFLASCGGGGESTEPTEVIEASEVVTADVEQEVVDTPVETAPEQPLQPVEQPATIIPELPASTAPETPSEIPVQPPASTGSVPVPVLPPAVPQPESPTGTLPVPSPDQPVVIISKPDEPALPETPPRAEPEEPALPEKPPEVEPEEPALPEKPPEVEPEEPVLPETPPEVEPEEPALPETPPEVEPEEPELPEKPPEVEPEEPALPETPPGVEPEEPELPETPPEVEPEEPKLPEAPPGVEPEEPELPEAPPESDPNEPEDLPPGDQPVPKLVWSAPATRTDSSPLKAWEVDKYQVWYGQERDNLTLFDEVPGGPMTVELDVSKLKPGYYFFAVTVVDVNALESERSEVVLKKVPDDLLPSNGEPLLASEESLSDTNL